MAPTISSGSSGRPPGHAQPCDVEVVASGGDLIAGEAAEAAFLALVPCPVRTPVGVSPEGGLKVFEMILCQRVGLAERWHLCAQVIDPDIRCCPLGFGRA